MVENGLAKQLAGGSKWEVIYACTGKHVPERFLVCTVVTMAFHQAVANSFAFCFSMPHSVVYDLVSTQDVVSDNDDRLEKFMHSNIRYENPVYATYRVSDKYYRPLIPEYFARWKYYEVPREQPLVVSSELVAQLSATVDLFSDEKASLLRIQRDMQRAAATTNVNRAFATQHSIFHSSARIIGAYNFHLRDKSTTEHRGIRLN
jgi:hypothetical protein